MGTGAPAGLRIANSIVRSKPALSVYVTRLVVSGGMGSDRMVLKVESDVRDAALGQRIAESVRDVTKLRADIEWADDGALPDDGKVIDDVRSYD